MLQFPLWSFFAFRLLSRMHGLHALCAAVFGVINRSSFRTQHADQLIICLALFIHFVFFYFSDVVHFHVFPRSNFRFILDKKNISAFARHSNTHSSITISSIALSLENPQDAKSSQTRHYDPNNLKAMKEKARAARK